MKPSAVAGLLLTVVVLATMLVTPTATAGTGSTWSRIMVSRDGKTWSTDIVQPLISKHHPFVPGREQSRTFYVRNQSGQKAYLKVVVKVTDQGRMISSKHFDLSLLVDGVWHTMAGGRQRVAKLLTRSGDVVPLRIKARMRANAGNKLMDRRLVMKVHLRLTHSYKTGR